MTEVRKILIEFIEFIGESETVGNTLIDSFLKLMNYTNIHIYFDKGDNVTCPKCGDEHHARKYQWLGKWYVMCHECGYGIPDPKEWF